MLSSNEIREKFLAYFESKSHTRVASSSLVPYNDPTLFFVNAGMVPFKDVFTGKEKRDYQRATSSQKCLRVSGKHNDLEVVGRTLRHHTFFEMLGNFSFGDYFKKEAIEYGWEFLTKVVGIAPSYLWITVYKDDEDAFKIWKDHIGVKKERIIRLGEKDNFWAMGETGPCGPCSEIHLSLKDYFDGKPSPGNPGTHGDDFLEIWNLVFMQFNRDSSGKMTPLPKPSIDTGMGLERLSAVLQKKKSNYETDLFWPLIEAIENKTSQTNPEGVPFRDKAYKKTKETDVSLRVIADHLRAMVFVINDGVQPSNEGRGYVLRRIMRRAIRHGKLLGLNEPFIYEAVQVLVKQMASVYPDLLKNQTFIQKVIKNEEEHFLQTLDKGLALIDEEIKVLKNKNQKIFSGKKAFQLYDTYGFPNDLTQLIAEENKMMVNMKEFENEMNLQKQKAKKAWKGSGQEEVRQIYHQLVQEGEKTKFVGYQELECSSKITSILIDGKLVDQAKSGDEVEIFVETTPFYAESGGQVGDLGEIISKKGKIQISDTQKPVEGLIAHHGKVLEGEIKVGDGVHLKVDDQTRRPTMLNHTATHIMHAALREILGDHVKQAGSVVDPERLRFDFSHFEALTREQIEKIELRVNEIIQANYPVTKEEMSLEEAKKKGALAFFGDKYGDKVRVVSIGPYSMEFCGGTHLNYSGEIGVFKIVSESSVASGVRRIEAITGMAAVKAFQNLSDHIQKLSSLLKATPEELPERISKMSSRVKELEREVGQLKTKLVSGGGSGENWTSQIKEANGVKYLAMKVEIDDPKALRDLSDQIKNKLKSGVVVLGAQSGDKALLLATVTDDLTKKYHAGQIIQKLAPLVGGKGGGKPEMAQAGGNQPENLSQALKLVSTIF